MKNSTHIIFICLFLILMGSCKQETKSYNVGAIISLTGPFAEYGDPVKKGMLLAEEQINLKGGIKGKGIRLIIEDDASVAKNSINSAVKLINVDKVPIILGPITSGNSMAVAPVSENNKTIQLSILAGIPDLSNAGDYIFRIYPSSTIGAQFAVDKAIEYFKPKKVAILYPSNPFGEVSKSIYKKTCENNGIEVGIIESYIDGAKDFRAQLTKISRYSPDIVLCSAYWIDGTNIVKQMIEMNIEAPVIGEDGWHGPIYQFIGKKGIQKVYFADILFGRDIGDNIEMQDFMNKFRLKYNQNATTSAAAGYDAVCIAEEAIRNAGYNPTSIKKYLYNINFKGSLGNIKYDANGDNVGLSFGLFQMDSLNNVKLIIK
jgi:branched-chain amino acid transport system substrate-binding protein